MIDGQRDARVKLLDAALTVIRTRGYCATTVDDLCRAAAVTKGAFFHHFKTKEELGAAAADHWSAVTSGLFQSAPYHQHGDPLERVLGYLEFRKMLIRGTLPEFTCLVGTMVQETFQSSPAIRAACERAIVDHAAVVETDIAAAMRHYRVEADWTAKSLALHIQVVIQGAFILAKAQQSRAVALDSIDHLIRYVKSLFPIRARRNKRLRHG